MVDLFRDDEKITPKMRTQITKDWLKEFPDFKKFDAVSMDRIVGPINQSIGYEVKWGDRIRIATSIFNLAYPTAYVGATIEVKPKSRRSDMNWKQHCAGKYLEAVAELRQYSGVPLDGDAKLSQILSTYKAEGDGVGRPTTRACMDPAIIVAWVGRSDLVEEWIEWGGELMKENYNGVFVERPSGEVHDMAYWYKLMREMCSDPEQLRQNVEDQIKIHKLEKMPRYQVIDDLD